MFPTIFKYFIGIIVIIFGSTLSFIAGFFFFSANLANKLNRIGTKFLFKVSGCKIVILGQENIDTSLNYLIVSNHKSAFDIVVLYAYLNLNFRFVAKKSLLFVPFLGASIFAERDIIIDRKNPFRAYSSLQRAIRFLKTKCSILIFPEGTRAKEHKMLPFKLGSLRLAFYANVPILPVTLTGTLNFMKKGEFKLNPTEIKLIISKPVYPSSFDKNLLLKVQQIIEENYDRAIQS